MSQGTMLMRGSLGGHRLHFRNVKNRPLGFHKSIENPKLSKKNGYEPYRMAPVSARSRDLTRLATRPSELQ